MGRGFSFFVFAASFLLFLLFQTKGIFGGDSGDLVTAAATFGVPHPPGYPLYTLLGWFLNWLPWFTPAWRVGLLSSLTHAATVTIVYALAARFTGKSFVGFFAALVLAGNYLFFLYSITPEVFGLFDLFLVLLFSLFIYWSETKKPVYFHWALFVFGLSLSHHHVILFFVPALLYWIYIHKQLLDRHTFFRLPFYVLIGLLPYVYLPIAGHGPSIINWNRPVDISSFVRLVTRADYGTFVSGNAFGTLLSQRMTQLKAYGQFLVLDLTTVGVLLLLLGFVWCWIHKRGLFWFLVIGLISLGPVFFFYASFPLANRFTLGTYERFLLPSYVLFSVLIGLGYWQSLQLVRRNTLLFWVFAILMLIYPMKVMGATMWKFQGVTNDRTADALAYDILAGVDADSILLVSRDTPLFTVQYVRYALGRRPDVMVIHASRLATADYPVVLSRVFPKLSVPSKTGESFLTDFIAMNRSRFPIFSVYPLAVSAGEAWVQEGLIYRLVRLTDAPSTDSVLAVNNVRWEQYHDPQKGILARYRHLMLADVLDVYAGAGVEFGKTLLRIGKLDDAKRYFAKAIYTDGDTQLSDAHAYAGLTDLFLKDCSSALDHFRSARETDLARVQPTLYLYEGITMRDCVGDAGRAKHLLQEYEDLKKKEETPLR
ncbi:DUF2723 domain-containing protein [Candidatus Gottesmanbacteria bacterium]|nr:DUF2723 domain-containing protein [Candidatus Gottesmanbacteria bacterium]